MREAFTAFILDEYLESAKHVGMGFHGTPVTVTYLFDVTLTLQPGACPELSDASVGGKPLQ